MTFFIIIAIVVVFYFLYKFFSTKSKSHSTQVEFSGEIKSLSSRKPAKRNLTLEESWIFLDKLTERIFKTFSKEDNTTIIEVGKTLAKAGLAYFHVIEYSLHNSEYYGKSSTKNTDLIKNEAKLKNTKEIKR